MVFTVNQATIPLLSMMLVLIEKHNLPVIDCMK